MPTREGKHKPRTPVLSTSISRKNFETATGLFASSRCTGGNKVQTVSSTQQRIQDIASHTVQLCSPSRNSACVRRCDSCVAFAGGEVRGYMIALHGRSHLITVFVERAEQLAEVM